MAIEAGLSHQDSDSVLHVEVFTALPRFGFGIPSKHLCQELAEREYLYYSSKVFSAIAGAACTMTQMATPSQTPNAFLVKSTIVAALGGLLFGFDTAVIAGTTHALTDIFQLSPGALGVTVLSALLGTILGAIFAGIPGDRWGRRDSLRIMAVLYVVSALGSALAWDWYSLMFFRFIGGLGIGGSSVLGPLYIAEIAPASWRGRLVGFFQFNVVAGILVAYLSNYLIGLVGFGLDVEWRWKLGVSAAPAAFFFLMLFLIPRSPRWLATVGRIDEARDVLQKTGSASYQEELASIQKSLSDERESAAVPLFSARHKLPIFLAISIGAFNQLSGINAILYYLNDIFAQAGFSKVSGDMQAVIVGFTNLLFTTIAMTMIDKLGRKRLLMIGALGTAACLLGVAIVFQTQSHQDLLVWLLVGFIAFFAFSQGAVIWVYLSEVFPQRSRAKGQSLGSFTHWTMNAIISAIFPLVAAKSGSLPFFFFAAMMVVQFAVVTLVYPETKGVSLEGMEKQLAAGH
ncbi:MAG TPA: sugar porter family MFS transporter [Bryobacteraceae bacterium]